LYDKTKIPDRYDLKLGTVCPQAYWFWG